MGVPGFFLWLMKNYKKEGFVFQKEKLTMTDINELIKLKEKKKATDEQIEKAIRANESVEPILSDVNSIDYFLIDAN